MHASLLPVVAYSSFMKDLYDFTRFRLTKDQLRDQLSYLPESYVLDQPRVNGVNVPYWQLVVNKNIIMEKTFNFRSKSYELPTDIPNKIMLSSLR